MDFKKIMSSYANFSKSASILIKDKALKKIQEGYKKATGNKVSLENIWDDLDSLFSLTKDYVRGNYTAISKSAIISVLAALLYFISPLDVIPDFILGLGFLDDVIVLRFVLKSVRKELKKYQAWKVEQKKIIHLVS